MPTFVWEGRTRGGEFRKGTLEAQSDNDLIALLRQQNISVTKVKKKGRELKLSLAIGTGVKQRDVVVFARQLATMIDAGLPLVQCLDILGNQADNRSFAKIILDVKARVEGGATFSDALASHPKVFDNLFVNLIAAGEIGGILDTILNRLATYMEKAMKLKAKVKGAMVYPVAIGIVAVLVVIVLLWKVIPVFGSMFRDMGAGELPALTQMVMTASNWFVDNVALIFISIIAFIVGFTAFKRNRKGKRILHLILLKMPIVGPVIRKTVVARFTRTFGTLLSSGVPILDAMEIVAKTAGNVIVEEAIMYARSQVAEGRDLATPLMSTKVFPPMVVQMLGVGEQTGAMDQMMQKIADFYEEEVDVAVGALTSLMEPLMMVFLGGLVGFILVAMYLPIFELAGNVRSD
ncbi:MAG: type II secretion system F family protein [Deltaproteobacteria bacterium]|nr:type II secretion system F family protein [Deltaproteobacteria bacterium]